MWIFIGIGVLSLITGALFIVAPSALRSLNELSSKAVINLGEQAFTYRMGVGISMIIASLLFFFVAYYFDVRG